MKVVKPNGHLLRTRAIAVLAIAIVTVAVLVGDLIGPSRIPMMLPIMVAYFVFNFGFVFILKGGGLTRATRLAAGAVVLNFVAMLLSDFEVAWKAATISAALVSVAAAFMLLSESRRAAA